MALTGMVLLTFVGKVPKAASSAPASHREQTSSSYSGNGANSPQPEVPLINTPVRIDVFRNVEVKFSANGTDCSAISAIDIFRFENYGRFGN